MTVETLVALFTLHDDEFLKFDRVPIKRSKRADLHAFMLLDELCPSTHDMVCSAEHDEIWLEVNIEKLAAVITERWAIDLIRCGVRLDEENGGLAMFV